MIKTVLNLHITKWRNLSNGEVARECLAVDYLDENVDKQIANLVHTDDVGLYDVKDDSWEDILQDWRLTKPYFVSTDEEKSWRLLEDYLQNLTEAQSQELVDYQNRLYEASRVADVLSSIDRLSDVGKATFRKMLDNGSDSVRDEYAKQWQHIVPNRPAVEEE